MAPYSEARLDAMRRRFPNLEPELIAAHRFAPSDTHIALAKLRLILERVVKAAFTHFAQRPLPEHPKLHDLLDADDFKSALPSHTLHSLHAVRVVANRAIHDERVSVPETVDSISRMLDILQWCSTWWETSSKAAGPSIRYEPWSPRRDPPTAPSTGHVRLMVGLGAVVFVVALVWLYIRVLLPGFMDEQQKNWLQRPQPASSVGGAVILSHPTPGGSVGGTVRSAYARNYPSSWPAPFFEEEIKPGAWGSWVEEPKSQRGASSSDQDFVWYWCVEAGGMKESGEWSIQCEDSGGIVRDVSAGHNEQCESARRVRIRNDWPQPAFVYYFTKHN
jgi:hypothetical protein